MSIAEKLATIAENEQKVYDAGKSIGYTEGEAAGYTTGKTEGEAIAQEKPFIDTSKITSFKLFCSPHKIPQAQLKNIDVSNASSLYQMFYSSQWDTSTYTVIPELKSSKALYFSHVFSGCSTLETIEGVDFSSGTQIDNMFNGCTSLKNLTVNGTIKTGKLDTSPCTLLSKASIESIINALARNEDEEGNVTPTGLTVTLSKTAVNNAFGIDVDDLTTWGEGTEYYNLRHSKDNWTISYV